jgi:F-type H+-transporting ATPase subunit beta
LAVPRRIDQHDYFRCDTNPPIVGKGKEPSYYRFNWSSSSGARTTDRCGILPGHLPSIYNAIEITIDGQEENLVAEVQQYLGRNWVRAVAMTSTEGLARGAVVVNTGQPITVPVGEGTLGRIFNVLGRPIDLKGPSLTTFSYPIHRLAPFFVEQSTQAEMFETGLKVIDLVAPFCRGVR